MPALEIARRGGVWLVVALYLLAVGADGIRDGDWTGLIAFTGFPLVGAIILTSRPRNGVGWFLLAYWIGWILGSYTVTRLFGDEPNLPIAIASNMFGYLYWPTVPIIGAIFPHGRFETRIGAVSTWTLLGANLIGAASQIAAPTVYWTDVELANPLASAIAPEVALIANIVYGVVAVASIVGIAIDVVIRWRRSRGVERQQFKWFGFGLISTFVLYVGVGMVLVLTVFPSNPGANEALGPFILVTIELIPASIGMAITRAGLYDIGRIVSRTVTYAIAAIAAIAVYSLIVLGVGALVPGDNPIVVAVATLAAAAVFLPLLRWAQRILDRRFDRERYDAEKVVHAFGEHLRGDVDPATTAPELVEAIERTLQPSAVGIWTTGGAR